MATQFTSITEWRDVKNDIECGLPREVVLKRYGIGIKKYYRVRKSTDWEHYKKLTNEATKDRYAAHKRSKQQELNKIIREAVYDRRTSPIPEPRAGATILPCLLIASVIIIAMIVSLIVSAVIR